MPCRQLKLIIYNSQETEQKMKRVEKQSGFWKRKRKSALGMVHDATAALAYATGNDSSFLALPTYARLVKLL